MEVRIFKYHPDLKRPAGAYIPLPKELKRKGIISIKTQTQCFLLSVLLGVFENEIKLPGMEKSKWEDFTYLQRGRLNRMYETPKSYLKLINRISKTNEINFNGFENEVMAKDFPKFETLNPNIGLNLFEYKNGEIIPTYIGDMHRQINIHLLLLSQGNNHHYCLITKLGRLSAKKNHKSCDICPHCFYRTTRRSDKHRKVCLKGTNPKMTFPKDDFYSFKNLKAYLPPNFKIFFMFLKSKYAPPVTTTKTLIYTTVKGNEDVLSYHMAITNYDDDLIFERYYDGDAAVEDFMHTFIIKLDEIYDVVENTFIPYEKSAELDAKLATTVSCEICKVPFASDRDKITHHHHQSKRLDLYRYTITCNTCNLGVTKTPAVAVSEDLGGRDAEILLNALLPEYADRFEILSQESTILTMTFDKKCRIIDRKKFVDQPIPELGYAMKMAKYKALHTSDAYGEFLASVLLDGVNLPMYYDIQRFSTLKELEESKAVDQEYMNLFYKGSEELFRESKEFMKSHVQEYVRCCVLILADFFWYLDRFLIDNFEISCLFYPSLSSYSFDSAMASSRATFQYLKCPEMVEFIKRGLKGPLEISNLKFAKSHSERFGCDDVTNENRQEILSIDLNMIYAHTASLKLPVSDYRFLDQSEIENLSLVDIPAGYGRLYEVSLLYPSSLHNEHNSFVLAPYRRKIDKSELSDHQRSYYDRVKSGRLEDERLCLDFGPRENYVCSNRYLNYLIAEGLQLTKIHNCLEYKEEAVLKKHVQRLARLRLEFSKQDNNLMAGLIKRLAVYLYGQTLKSSEFHTKTVLVTNRYDCVRLA
ncbi:hypothetical protein Fcan01_22953 [Folsomia candida]|uniref:DNA-directed DNA polymerase n=1 Tax=Folsomia candida TaxID=158441 RepID=A0A226DB11_FOLCA|nr:hypothetical protein Fcan01_22953 [Folsomia candida]